MSDESKDKENPTDEQPTILKGANELISRAIIKWVNFNQDVYGYIIGLGKNIRRDNRWGALLRVLIIIFSATITTISDIDGVPRTVVTILSGIMTVTAGVEGYFKFSERSFDAKKTQRELESLRDALRYEWFVNVEVGDGELEHRLEHARKLLELGPAKFNEVLTKYVMQSEKAEAPEMNAGG